MDRLDMTFASRQAYHDFWRRHPAIGGDWSAHVERYLDYDLMGEPPNLRPRTRKDVVVADTKSQLVEDLVPRSLTALRAAVRLLRAPRGILNDSPLYTEERIEPWARRIGGFSATTIPDVNHYTILLAERRARWPPRCARCWRRDGERRPRACKSRGGRRGTASRASLVSR
jgi:hypothetical protein